MASATYDMGGLGGWSVVIELAEGVSGAMEWLSVQWGGCCRTGNMIP